jgi:hypothetical protein
MPYKFEQLEVWKLALDYIDLAYKLAENLRSEFQLEISDYSMQQPL